MGVAHREFYNDTIPVMGLWQSTTRVRTKMKQRAEEPYSECRSDDAMVVGASRQPLCEFRRVRLAPGGIVLWLAVGAVVVVAVGSFGFFRVGSVCAGFEYVAGKRLFVTPSRATVSVQDASDANDRHPPSIQFTVANFTDRRLAVIGSASACSCLEVRDGLPASISSGGSARITASVVPIRMPDSRSVKLTLLTDSPDDPLLTVIVDVKVD